LFGLTLLEERGKRDAVITGASRKCPFEVFIRADGSPLERDSSDANFEPSRFYEFIQSSVHSVSPPWLESTRH